MTTFVSKEVQAGIDAARKQSLRQKSRLRVRTGGEVFPILRIWENGFAMDSDLAPNLRGHVELMDGAHLLSRCLIVASEEEGDQIKFEFKRNTAVQADAPLDFYRDENAPIAFLTANH